MPEGLGPPPGEPQQIGEPLAHGADVAVAAGTLAERLERALVVANRVFVGMHRARPIAGGDQVARPAELVRAEAPVMTECFEVD